MNIKDVLRWIGEQLDLPEGVIQEAFDYANASAGQGEEAKKSVNKELSDEEVESWKTYGLLVIRTCLVDPEFRRKFTELAKARTIDKN
jgi:hypothetical protein